MERLEVRLDFGPSSRPVGTLQQRQARIFFEFAPEFLEHPLPISPINLAVQPGVVHHDDRGFHGLHGVFADSLPDGWGLMLIDRELRNHGVPLTALNRLAYLHDRGMGALTYHPASELNAVSGQNFTLTTLAAQAERIVRGSEEEVLPDLQLAGGSPGGARPKVAIGFNPDSGEMDSDAQNLAKGFEHWIVKFRAAEDPEDMGLMEYTYSAMAREAGVTMPPTRLFSANNTQYFGVKRFDRDGNKRFHMHTLAGLLHATHIGYSLEYDKFIRATRAITNDVRELHHAFRYAAFNLFAHVRDDHTKNFSFLMNERGEWRLAPAYDLTYSPGFNGYHTMGFGSPALHPTTADLLRIAETVGIEQQTASDIIDEVRTATSKWGELAKTYGVSNKSLNMVQKALIQIK